MSRAPARARKASEADLFAALRTRSAAMILLYGPEETMAEDIARRLGAALGEAERIDIESARLRDDAGLLTGEASSPSLFGGARWIRLRFAREEGLDAVAALLASDVTNTPVIATAGNLTPASKLRKLVEASPRALSLGCYAASTQDATQWVTQLCREQGLRIDARLAQRIAESAALDRMLARVEVEKLALYLDAAPDRPATVEADHVEALSADTAEENVGALVAHALGGEPRKLAADLAMARALGMSEVRILKALQRRAASLVGMAARIAGGEDIESVVKGVFFREQPAMRRELQRWSPARLARLVERLLDAERAIMQAGRDLGGVLMEQELLAIARSVAGKGR